MNRTDRRRAAKSHGQVRRAILAKKRRGLTPPTECPNCRADLHDEGVPDEFKQYRDLFSLVLEYAVKGGGFCWVCPRCQHRWGRHEEPIG